MSVVDYLPNLIVLAVFFFIARGVLRVITHFFVALRRSVYLLAGFILSGLTQRKK
jgi:hypothetical protein